MSMEQGKKTQILIKDNEQTTSHSLFIRTILKEQLDLQENKKNNQHWNQFKKFLSKFGKQKCTVINK